MTQTINEQAARKEALKLLFEVYKHITTLSTAAIVILATFLEKFSKSPKGIYFVTISIICLLLSVVTSLSLMAQFAMEQQNTGTSKPKGRIAQRLLYRLSPTAFMLGIISLAIFIAINL